MARFRNNNANSTSKILLKKDPKSDILNNELYIKTITDDVPDISLTSVNGSIYTIDSGELSEGKIFKINISTTVPFPYYIYNNVKYNFIEVDDSGDESTVTPSTVGEIESYIRENPFFLYSTHYYKVLRVNETPRYAVITKSKKSKELTVLKPFNEGNPSRLISVDGKLNALALGRGANNDDTDDIILFNQQLVQNVVNDYEKVRVGVIKREIDLASNNPSPDFVVNSLAYNAGKQYEIYKTYLERYGTDDDIDFFEIPFMSKTDSVVENGIGNNIFGTATLTKIFDVAHDAQRISTAPNNKESVLLWQNTNGNVNVFGFDIKVAKKSNYLFKCTPAIDLYCGLGTVSSNSVTYEGDISIYDKTNRTSPIIFANRENYRITPMKRILMSDFNNENEISIYFNSGNAEYISINFNIAVHRPPLNEYHTQFKAKFANCYLSSPIRNLAYRADIPLNKNRRFRYSCVDLEISGLPIDSAENNIVEIYNALKVEASLNSRVLSIPIYAIKDKVVRASSTSSTSCCIRYLVHYDKDYDENNFSENLSLNITMPNQLITSTTIQYSLSSVRHTTVYEENTTADKYYGDSDVLSFYNSVIDD